MLLKVLGSKKTVDSRNLEAVGINCSDGVYEVVGVGKDRYTLLETSNENEAINLVNEINTWRA